ncbi:MAG: DUF2225 domain-containing protein [Bacillota bacterium]
MTTDIMGFLRGLPLFNILSPVYLARLSEKSVTMRFEKGKVILDEGKHCNNLFITFSGKLEAYKKIDDNSEIIIRTFNRGDTYGEAYLLDGSPVDASLRASEASFVICVDRQTVISLMKENTEFSKSYIRRLSNMAREAAAKEEIFLRVLLDSGLEIPEGYSVRNPNETVPSSEVNSMNTQEESGDEIEGEDEVFFKKEYTCPLCRKKFGSLKPRQKYIVIERTDEDFCTYYKTVNPLFYEINVCPLCGYSFNNSTSGPVKIEIKDSLIKILTDIWGQANYCGLRELESAIETFKLAIECQRGRGADDGAMGKLFLKLAWLYRYSRDNNDHEQKNLEKALYHLSKSFENGSEGPKEEMNLMFLLGQLSRMLGYDKDAVNWFIRITQHPDKKSYPYMVNRARDAWQNLRAELKGQ